MLTIVGTIPLEEGIYAGKACFQGKDFIVNGVKIPVERGTGALAAASLRILEQFGSAGPYCLFAGDQCSGVGSQRLLEELISFLPQSSPQVLVLHYMFVLLKYGEALKTTIQGLAQKPLLIGDAGGMYLAKASGIGQLFDIFTPDFGELAFLADQEAIHPMYTKPEFFQQKPEDLIYQLGQGGKMPKTLVVKGKVDLLVEDGQIVNTVQEPSLAAMEAIGGTGDTVTGILAALNYLKVTDANYQALKLNRLVGQKLGCTPRTQIQEFINDLDYSLLKD